MPSQSSVLLLGQNLRSQAEQGVGLVSFKKGFDKDISPATISSWIKQTEILCYELSDQQVLTLHQVKANDVRPLLLLRPSSNVGLFLLMGWNSSLSSLLPQSRSVNKGGSVSIPPGNPILVTDHDLIGLPDLRSTQACELCCFVYESLVTYLPTKW